MKKTLLIVNTGLIITLNSCTLQKQEVELKRPNILFAISDDQSFPHTSFTGSRFVNTPGFDRVASEGVFFTSCIAGSPGCAPSRSVLVTGRYHWQNEQSGQHASSWMKKYVPFIDLLDANGYITGRTGKGVAPFRYGTDKSDSLWRDTDAGGIAHSDIHYEIGTPGDERTTEKINTLNYFENFRYFMEDVRQDEPFFFWYGAIEPHRDFELDSWKRTDKRLEDVDVPDFLPDNEIIRGDLLDYAVAIEWFDLHLQRMIAYLEEIGELENTIIIVTSDNGMAFPRAKANAYDYGIHVPFAVRFPKAFPGGRIIEDPVDFSDFAPTVLELTRTSEVGMLPISGKSLVNVFSSDKQGHVDPEREYAFTGRERHSSSRYKNWGYPQRAIRGKGHLLIWNIKPDRWPAGDPQRINPGTTDELLPMFGIDETGTYTPFWAFTDIDECPTKTFIIENWKDEAIRPYFDWAHAKRPEYELFDVVKDPYCLNNLAGNPEHASIENEMRGVLMEKLKVSGDPRVVGPDHEVFDSYLRYSPARSMRDFPKPE